MRSRTETQRPEIKHNISGMRCARRTSRFAAALVCLLAALTAGNTALAGAGYVDAAQDGNWNDPSTWDNHLWTTTEMWTHSISQTSK